MARMQYRAVCFDPPGFGRVQARQSAVSIALKQERSFCCYFLTTESLILAQNEHWRRGLGMQVERESFLREMSKVANG